MYTYKSVYGLVMHIRTYHLPLVSRLLQGSNNHAAVCLLLLKNWQGMCELLEDLESSTLEPAEFYLGVSEKFYL